MKKSTLLVLGIVAALLITSAVVLLTVGLSGSTHEPASDPETEGSSEEKMHDNVEYDYDANGKLHQIRYYENNVYQGSTDYVYFDDYDIIANYDENNELTDYAEYFYNEAGNTIKQTQTVGDVQIFVEETVFYSDLTSPRKRTTKTMEGDVETAVKRYFNENGLETRHCVYVDGVLESDETYVYDKNGELLETVPTEEGAYEGVDD